MKNSIVPREAAAVPSTKEDINSNGESKVSGCEQAWEFNFFDTRQSSLIPLPLYFSW